MISQKDLYLYKEHSRIMLRTNAFICLRPHPVLGQYISNYNITFPAKGLMAEGFTVMPSGCPVLTIEIRGPKLSITLEGPSTKPYTVDSKTNLLEMFVTIEFRPAGLFALTGIPQNELVDLFIPFEAVHPGLCQRISEVTERAESVHGLVSGLDKILFDHMVTACNPQFMETAHRLLGSGGTVAVKSLSEDIHYSERQLNRIFIQHAGVGVKSFSRLIRMNKAFQLLMKPHHSLQLVSDRMGFYDLSHFIREFRLLCGMTPQAFRSNMSDFYINPARF